jgi:ArsR family transcriptional regulator
LLRRTAVVIDENSVAHVARALSHPARVRIVALLAEQTECRGAEVFGELPLAQSTISEHLRILREAGLISSQSVGTGMVYCLVPGALDEFTSALAELSNRAPECHSTQKGC